MLFPAGGSEWERRVGNPHSEAGLEVPISSERHLAGACVPDAGLAASSHVGLRIWTGLTQAWAKLWLGSSQGKGPGKNYRWVKSNNSPVVPSIPSLSYHPDEQWKVSPGE